MGARVEGPDLTRDLSAREAASLQALLAENLVLVLPDQKIDEQQHVRFSTHFGDLYLHPFLEAVPADPAVLNVLTTETDIHTFGGEFWHADITFSDPPAAVSVLYGIEIPAIGGDTLFANQFLAFETLSTGMQTMLESLNAHHTYTDMAEDDPGAHALHPVVRTHPVSGNKALFVNPAFVSRFEAMTEAESRPLLQFLFDHQVRPEFQIRVTWQPHQVTMWDNRATQHYAMNDHPGQRRRLQRVTAMERPTP
jgi:taurine dioxygenase